MARLEINEVVWRPSDTFVQVIPEAEVLVKDLNGATVTLYDARTGGAEIPNPTTTDVYGRIDGPEGTGAYVSVGDLPVTLEVSGAGFATYDQEFHSNMRAISYTGAGSPVDVDQFRYAAVEGNALNDGLSWGSPFADIQQAVDDLGAAGGAVFIASGDYTEEVLITTDVSLIGIVAPSGGRGVRVVAPSSSSTCIEVVGAEGIQISNIGTTGASDWDGIGLHMHSSCLYCRVSSFWCMGTGTPSATNGPTGLKFENFGFFNVFENLVLALCSLGIHVGANANINTFIQPHGSENYRDLLVKGTGPENNPGGSLWIGVNCVGSTAFDPAYVVEIAGSQHTFIGGDGVETSDPNTWLISGNQNRWLNPGLSPLMRLLITGHGNVIDGPRIQSGGIELTGSANRIIKPVLFTGDSFIEDTNLGLPNVIDRPDPIASILGGVAGGELIASLSTVTPTYESLAASTTADYIAEVQSDSPNAVWSLGELSGNVANDLAELLPGTYTGALSLGQPGVPPGARATEFRGTTGYVTVPDDAAFDVGDVFTLEAWIRTSDIDGGAIISKGSNGYLFYLKYDNVSAAELALEKQGAVEIVQSTVTVTDGAWHHVVVTKNGATVKLYVDGVDVTGTVTNATFGNTGHPLNIGRRVEQDSMYFTGLIDFVAIYPTALSAARVLAHFDVGVGT